MGQLAPETDDTIWWLFAAHQTFVRSAYADRYSMNEFIGRVTYPFLFFASARRSSTGRLTHASMSRTGASTSLVRMLKGPVSSGGTVLLFAARVLRFGEADSCWLPCGESARA